MTDIQNITEQIRQLPLPEKIHISAIHTGQLVFQPELRKFCEENVCGSYGNNYGCPPDAGTVEELIGKVKSYPYALVYQLENTYGHLEKPVYQYPELILQARKEHQDAGDMIQRYLEEKQIPFYPIGSGKCMQCTECARQDGQPCRKPGQMRRSLSAFCINVSKLAESCNMTFGDANHTLTYFGLFCILH